MERHELENLLLWKRRQFLRLTEARELTVELSRALASKDEMSVRILLSMRQEPIRQAEELEESVRAYLLTLPEEDAIHLSALLKGEVSPLPEEKALWEQVGRNRRLLEDTVRLDRELSVRLGGNRSYYRKCRVD